MNGALFAMLALLPLMAGPLDSPRRSITAQLCSGGSLTIPLRDKKDRGVPGCPQKACHAGTCRKRS